MLRTNVEFSCDMPYDAVEGAGGEFIEMPARTVAQAMADMLVELGCAVGAVESAGDHGWDFRFTSKSADVTCEVTAIDGVVAQFFGPEDRKPGRGQSRSPRADYVEILTAFGEALGSDPRFRDVGWFSGEELTREQAGAVTPTGAYDSATCRRTFGPAPVAVRTAVIATSERAAVVVEGWEGFRDLGPYGAWRRFAARMFDHCVVVGGLLLLAVRYLPPLRSTAFGLTGYAVLAVIAGFSVILNAILMRHLSTTPGKWLCRVRVVRADGGRLTYGAAFRREAEAILVGCASLIYPWIFVASALNFVRLVFTDDTSWDRRQGSVVLQAPASRWTRLAICLCLLSSYVVVSLWP